MFSVALIGADGAGKTTLLRRLEDSFPLPMRGLYMGVNLESSNVSLPTSRLAATIKRWLNKRSQRSANSLHSSSKGTGKMKKSRVWASLRLLNFVAEEWYRQMLSWKYRKQGFLVVYDRHFQFDFEPVQDTKKPLSDRIHRWLLAHCYPSPDLTIFLDAPAEVLFARKSEAPLEYLEARRQAFLLQGQRTRNFVRVDAAQPLDAVYRDVSNHILAYARTNRADAWQTARSTCP
jgi:thymidylate kinase